MEASKIGSVWFKRLEEAKEKKEHLKLIFQYPSSDRAIVKRGFVIDVFEDGFNFNEKFDGDVSYSFQFLVEIKSEDLR